MHAIFFIFFKFLSSIVFGMYGIQKSGITKFSKIQLDWFNFFSGKKFHFFESFTVSLCASKKFHFLQQESFTVSICSAEIFHILFPKKKCQFVYRKKFSPCAARKFLRKARSTTCLWCPALALPTFWFGWSASSSYSRASKSWERWYSRTSRFWERWYSRESRSSEVLESYVSKS